MTYPAARAAALWKHHACNSPIHQNEQPERKPADRNRLRVGSNPPQGWHLIGASQGVLPRSRRQVHKRVNGCPGRPGHYVETLSIHTPNPHLFCPTVWEKGWDRWDNTIDFSSNDHFTSKHPLEPALHTREPNSGTNSGFGLEVALCEALGGGVFPPQTTSKNAGAPQPLRAGFASPL